MDQRASLLIRPLIALVAVVTVLAPGQAAPPEYVLMAKPARRVEAVQTFDVTYPKFKASQWIGFAAAAPEMPSQQKVSTKLSPGGKAGVDASELKRPIVSGRVAASDKQRAHFQMP